MSLRVLAVTLEFSGGLLLLGWGALSAVRPACWHWRGARGWVDRTRRTISRLHGAGVGLIGAAIMVSAPAPVLGRPAAPGGIDAHALEIVGLLTVLAGGVLLAATYPGPEAQPARPGPAEQGTTGHDPVTQPSSAVSPAPATPPTS